MVRLLGLLVAWFTVAGYAHGALKTKEISYKAGDVQCRGYLAWDDTFQGPRPGVLVLHEWWGLDAYARHRAEQLAKLGYIAFAGDMYGEGKTAEHPKQAGEMAGQVRANVQTWRMRAAAALEVLKSQPQCDATKLAAIGYCFGGSTALQLAYAGADLDAVVTFHAGLSTPSAKEASQIKPSILICNGGADALISEESIGNLRAALDKAKVDYEVVSYPGVKHSFTVPDADKHGIPALKYDKAADEDSWKRMRQLFEKKLGK